ncbi:MAG: Sec-independent protein translocase subunit TatA [Dermatophilaceae bacterium]
MGIKDLFEGSHLLILLLVVVVLFGYKRLPDTARSIGRSLRVFKSEVDDMKSDTKTTSSVN